MTLDSQTLWDSVKNGVSNRSFRRQFRRSSDSSCNIAESFPHILPCFSQPTSNMTSIRSSVLHGVKDLRIETHQLPPPEPNDLQISVRTTGLCGSDLHYYHHFRNGDILVREPLSLGHESAGIVEAVGSDVDGFEVGDQVALEVGMPCETCARCQEGRYNICEAMRFRSSARVFPHAQGTLQERINHPARWCHKLPHDVSLEHAALLEPLSVAVHASKRAKLKGGEKALVLGAGTVGLLVATMAIIRGAESVVIADIDAGRVSFATNNGFAHAGFPIPLRRPNSNEESLVLAQETAESIKSKILASGSELGAPDIVFECTGVPSCLQTAIFATRPGGKVMLIGMGNPVQTLPISAAALREIDLVGVFRYADTYPEGITLVQQTISNPNLPDISKLITHRFEGLDSIKDAFEMAARSQDDSQKMVLKVMMTMGEAPHHDLSGSNKRS
ncbi:GroES-like protein [Eremomyces bilateralis CBS 781.70]|uniref:GroES-like protein n=1 Tax=Eremomyces bilateralis CBS 781.70 TaxID=1392243 RepID=A0A6G1G458_9PEZI|nr:GroES-like protein [Eremomyces bilateralis CBS 781.70]KAF1812609.1 GroES-like protein [Eremomyces bilateralis CBS 781.70]